MKYAYEVAGKAADGQTWTTKGVVGDFKPGQFNAAVKTAMADAFMDLTHGHAVYGYPGKGCDGPYAVTRLLIEEERNERP
jgi:hypothetical protein